MAKTFGIDKSLGFKIDDIKYHPYSIIGKKASSLGTLVNLGLPVPSGFVLTGEAYRRFLDENDVYPNLSKPMEIPQRIRIGGTSEMLYNVIERLYREMSASHGTSRGRVIVRSSPFHIGYPDLIFEGLSETRTNISGTDQIIVAYRDVISSIFTDKEITYRQTHGISHDGMYMPVIVQMMITPLVSGIMSLVDPNTGDPNTLVRTLKNWLFSRTLNQNQKTHQILSVSFSFLTCFHQFSPTFQSFDRAYANHAPRILLIWKRLYVK